MMPAKKRARSAETGRWVTLKYALVHPLTTVLEKVRRRGD